MGFDRVEKYKILMPEKKVAKTKIFRYLQSIKDFCNHSSLSRVYRSSKFLLMTRSLPCERYIMFPILPVVKPRKCLIPSIHVQIMYSKSYISRIWGSPFRHFQIWSLIREKVVVENEEKYFRPSYWWYLKIFRDYTTDVCNIYSFR